MPTHAAIEPHSASPSGSSAIEPNQSYALTRDSAPGGTWRWSAVSQTVLETISPAPETNAAAASSGTGAATARHASGSEKNDTHSVATTRGRLGSTCSASTPPTSEPAPAAASTAAHAAAPPSSRCATTGPSTFQDPTSTFPSVAPATNVQTHVIERKTSQPCRRSTRNGRAGRRTCAGSVIPDRNVALAANVRASIASAQPAPAVATSTPATTGPAMS